MSRPVLPAAVALAALVAGFATSPARADDAELPGTTLFFETYDADYDGFVTREEFRGSKDVFRLLDVDGDGRICPTELGLPAEWKPDPAKKRPERTRGRAGATPGRPRDGYLERLKEMDADGDGKVSRDEWNGPTQAFERLDRNGDGFIDPADVRGAMPGQPGEGRDMRRGGEIFDRLDTDKDGVLSAEEIGERPFLKRLDTDGDGRVTKEEAMAAARQMGSRGADARRGRGLTQEGLRRFDRDGDGKVTADEFPGNERQFGRLDRNGDGVLDSADLEAEPEERPQGPPRPTTPSTPNTPPAPAPDAPAPPDAPTPPADK